MADELIDIFDEDHQWVGTALKSAAHRLGFWHYAIHCWIYRIAEDGSVRMLFQKRAADKQMLPNYLDVSVAGHYQAGETADDGVREILEELGVSLEISDLRYLGLRTEAVRIEKLLNREFCRVYLWQSAKAPHEYSPDTEEVEGLVEISVEDGLALFTHQVDSVAAIGVEWKDGAWVPYENSVTRDLFVPRRDRYYYQMITLARLAAAGEPHLAV
jgi:isopentenyldiphosphate isomerase